MPQFSTWLIDLDGTLYRSLPVKLAMGAELCAASRQVRYAVREFRREHERLRHEILPAGESPFSIQVARTAQRLSRSEDDVRAIIDEWMFVRPGRWLRRFRRHDLIAEIVAFRASGGRTALISDYPAQQKLKSLGTTHLFDVVLANGESSSSYQLKPSPDSLRQAAEQLQVRFDECLVLGDRLDADGLAAKHAGMAFRRIPGSVIV